MNPLNTQRARKIGVPSSAYVMRNAHFPPWTLKLERGWSWSSTPRSEVTTLFALSRYILSDHSWASRRHALLLDPATQAHAPPASQKGTHAHPNIAHQPCHQFVTSHSKPTSNVSNSTHPPLCSRYAHQQAQLATKCLSQQDSSRRSIPLTAQGSRTVRTNSHCIRESLHRVFRSEIPINP